MVTNFLKIAIRSLLKFKGYAAINLIGLALGLTTGIFIMIYVIDEISFDDFQTKSDRIYRVVTDMVDIKSGVVNGSIEGNGWPVGVQLKKDYPEIESVIYIRNGSNLFLNHDGKRFEQRLFYASEDFFNVFSFPLKEGNPSTALSQPNSIVITEEMERKFFPEQNALGKTLTFADTLSLEITGVTRETSSQSHMEFDMLVSFSTYTSVIDKEFDYSDGWGNLNVRNYVLLREGADKKNFISNARNIYVDYVKDKLKKYGMYLYADFEPLGDIYLKTTRGNGMGPLGSLERVYMVSGIALFVILLACINFINLATARSTYRAKEVGLRKVVGSSRWSLIGQFLTESFLLTIISFLAAIALFVLLLPFFNGLVGKTYGIGHLFQPSIIAGSFFLVVVISLLSGYYPALVISSLRPAEVLKGKMHSNPKGIQLRRTLVIFQFVISATLVIFTLIVQDQLQYMRNRDLGFFGDQLIALDISKLPSIAIRSESFKNELKALPGIEYVSFTNALPGKPGWVGQWAYAADKTADETIGVEYMSIDEDYLSTLGLTLLAGHNFDPARSGEFADGLIVNEKTVEKMGWETSENAIGKKIKSPSGSPSGTVIGVVKNYHEFGLQKEIYPMTMAYHPEDSRFFVAKFKSERTTDLLVSLQKTWQKHYDGYDFEYFFVSENFERQYQAEQKLTKVFTLFSTITIIVAIIGLLGLVSFMIVSRTKEIGIRKILGANVLNVTRLLSAEFLVLVFIAIMIACPLSYYLATQWLEKFAFRAPLGTGVFIVTLVAGLSITVVAVSFQTIKAALSNPVESLRNE